MQKVKQIWQNHEAAAMPSDPPSYAAPVAKRIADRPRHNLKNVNP
jgi:hypothetical protein